jgi:hypothetical protein
MAYRFDDLMVNDVKGSHEAHAKKQSSRSDSLVIDRETMNFFYGNNVLHNGVLVPKELKAFMTEVAKVFRGVEFYAHSVVYRRNNGVKWKWGKMDVSDKSVIPIQQEISVQVACEVAVAYPNDKYCIGIIGYGDFQKSTKDNVYMVSSRNIENNKYAVSSDEYHFLLSGDVTRAVKNARTHLRQYNAKDFMGMSADEAREYATKAREDAHSRESTAAEKLSLRDMHDELGRILASGYVFQDTKLHSQITAWMDAKAAYAIEEARKVPAVFVYIKQQVADRQMVEYAFCNDLRSTYSTSMSAISSLHTCSLTDLPEDFVGKLSVLSLLKDNDYVEGVGVRVSDNVYWVEGEDVSPNQT